MNAAGVEFNENQPRFPDLACMTWFWFYESCDNAVAGFKKKAFLACLKSARVSSLNAKLSTSCSLCPVPVSSHWYLFGSTWRDGAGCTASCPYRFAFSDAAGFARTDVRCRFVASTTPTLSPSKGLDDFPCFCNSPERDGLAHEMTPRGLGRSVAMLTNVLGSIWSGRCRFASCYRIACTDALAVVSWPPQTQSLRPKSLPIWPTCISPEWVSLTKKCTAVVAPPAGFLCPRAPWPWVYDGSNRFAF